MAGPALCTLRLLLCCWLSCVAGSDNGNNDTVAVTYLMDLSVWEPRQWGIRPQPRLFLPKRTFWGRPIPGLASRSVCCGKVNTNTKIVGGTATVPNAFPWMAAIVSPGQNIPFCGGSLINDRYVLTAAHCLYDESAASIQIILGKHELAVNSGNDLRLNVMQIIIHPRYRPSQLGNDFALVKLITPLALPIGNNLIAPVCLPTRSVYVKESAEAAGWGFTQENGSQPDRLHSVRLETLSKIACSYLNSRVITRTMLCATGDLDFGGRDTCQGDSGGPLVVRARGSLDRRALIGITSWGYGCARVKSPGVYARVTAELDWLVLNTRDAVYC